MRAALRRVVGQLSAEEMAERDREVRHRGARWRVEELIEALAAGFAERPPCQRWRSAVERNVRRAFGADALVVVEEVLAERGVVVEEACGDDCERRRHHLPGGRGWGWSDDSDDDFDDVD